MHSYYYITQLKVNGEPKRKLKTKNTYDTCTVIKYVECELNNYNTTTESAKLKAYKYGKK